jgi:predicted nucleic acid-binding protein
VNDKEFIDTNIVVYAYSPGEPDKRLVARELFKKSRPVVSTQVLGEFSTVLRKKFRCEYAEIARAMT